MLYEALKKARLDEGLTTAEVVAEVELNQSSLSRIELGDVAVSSQRLIDLARLDGVSPSKLPDGAVVRALAEEDLNRLGQVITCVEDILQGQKKYPFNRNNKRYHLGDLSSGIRCCMGNRSRVQSGTIPRPHQHLNQEKIEPE